MQVSTEFCTYMILSKLHMSADASNVNHGGGILLVIFASLCEQTKKCSGHEEDRGGVDGVDL